MTPAIKTINKNNHKKAYMKTGKNTVFSYLNAWEPKSVNGGPPKYSVTLIISKNDTETISKINNAVLEAYEQGRAKLESNGIMPLLSDIKHPLRDGDKERPGDNAYKNSVFLNATSMYPPGIVDADRKPITKHSEMYSGVIGRASIHFYAYNGSKNQKGIACCLDNLQKFSDGTPLGTRTPPEEDFKDIDD